MDLRGTDRNRTRRSDRQRPRTGALRTTFETVPDAPVTSFVLNLEGGSKGLLFKTRKSLCGKPKRAKTRDDRPERRMVIETGT